MASVLGKRTTRERTDDSTQDFSISSRVKRRARVPLVNDENDDPSLTSLHLAKDNNAFKRVRRHQSGSSFTATQPAGNWSCVALSSEEAGNQSKAYVDETTDENVVQLPTPKTPRHRDALSKRIPITPRHKIGPVGQLLTPRTPRTPTASGNVPTVYECARRLFTRSADPGPLIGRESERRELSNFVEEGIRSKAGRCMYVSGPPGTGKSALVNEVCRGIDLTQGVKTVYINCMSVKCSKDVYGKLLEALIGQDVETEQESIVDLKALFIPKKKSPGPVYVVTLDEIDHLLTLDLEIIYSLFEWSLHRSSRLIVLGIANALDLTDRFLPRLKARNLKPQLLPFLPYTAPEIASVISTKLKSLSMADASGSPDHVPFLVPAAVQLCSKKIASQSGDLRKAFDIVRRTIDVIEAETKQKFRSDLTRQSLSASQSRSPLSEITNCRSPQVANTTSETSLAELTALTAPRATIAHVSRVSAAALSNGTSQRLQTLNLQQKAALCALLSHQKTSRAGASSIFATPPKACAAPTMRKLYATYCMLCKRENALHPLTNTEFVDIMSGLETLGLVGEPSNGRGSGTFLGTPSKKGKGIGEEKRVICFVDVDEVKACLEGVSGGVLSGLLGGGE